MYSEEGSWAKIFINDEGKPANIPDLETIIKTSIELGPKQATKINISGVRIALDKKSQGDISDIWVKFGSNIRMGEALTQQFVGKYIKDNNIQDVRAPHVYIAFSWGGWGFIVSEFIDGRMCDNSDVPLVGAALQALIAIPSPSSTPGPVGGGIMEHPFFYWRTASIQYESVKDLEDHVNGVSHVVNVGTQSNTPPNNYQLRSSPSRAKKSARLVSAARLRNTV